MRSIHASRLALAAILVSLTAPAVAQGDFAKEEKDLTTRAISTLLSFASNAKSNKVDPRAKAAYDLILDHYDVDNPAARGALGFKKVKDKWEAPPEDKAPKWDDRSNNEQRYRIVDEWRKTAQKLAALHRDLGLKLSKTENLARGKYHLERAVQFDPFDKEAHLALGHKEHQGFFGPEEEVAFVQRMREIETKALELAKTEFPVEALPQEQMPEEFAAMGLEFHGAKSAHFTIWTRGTQENADLCAKWSERGLTFLVWLVGEDMAKKRAIVKRASTTFGWFGFVWTEKEREDLLTKNPKIWKGPGKSIEDAKRFVNVTWPSAKGLANVQVRLMPSMMYDSLITYVFHYGLNQGLNPALSEGLQHAATWYLMSTSSTTFSALPEGTVASREMKLPESTSWWLRKVRDDALAATDWPLTTVVREQLSRFRNGVRLKSWSFMTWVVARYPDKWLQFFSMIPAGKVVEIEALEKASQKAFGKPMEQVEAEWRAWARGDSGVSAATGYGPPLLPEKPNKEELSALARMNQIRGTNCAFVLTGTPDSKGNRNATEGKMISLPPTDLDAEATMACEDHATYLTKWPEEHLKWPEAHEQNPAREGFSPRGMRAAMRSVILWSTGMNNPEFSRDAVDGWMGTVYHRFPLLEHNINRFGYAYVTENGYSIGVLDMGSLQEPYDPSTAPQFVAWPPPGMKEVPLQFHGIEHPNPLDDQPESERDITKTGYPISLQFQRETAGRIVESSIHVYKLRTGKGELPKTHFFQDAKQEDLVAWRARRDDPKKPEDQTLWKLVECWNHTPAAPLLKRMEDKGVVFAIPKEHLEPKTTYQVEVLIKQHTVDAQLFFVWEFTTGSQDEGLKFGK